MYHLLCPALLAEQTDNDENDNIMEVEAHSDQESSELESESHRDEAQIVHESFPRLAQHFRCGSHSLNLVATTDMMKIMENYPDIKAMHESAINGCGILWKFLSSTKTREKLTGYLGCSLSKPVVTRCNSLYDCIKQIFSLKEKLKSFDLQAILRTELPLNDANFLYLKEYLALSKPLAAAIDILHGEKDCHYGYMLPTLIGISRKWTDLIRTGKVVLCKPLLEDLGAQLE